MSAPGADLSMGGRVPLVSIVTPCFNAASFIGQCVESVLAQSYPSVEHIVQDGASTDGTVEILRRYTGPRVDWVSEPDHGQADALDKALKRSCGDILLVLNADDVLLPHAAGWAVKRMARYAMEAVIYGDLYLIDEEGNTTGEFVAPEYDFASILCVERVLPAQAAFIRRSALEEVGFGADVTLDTCPDYEMFVRLGLRFPMRHVPGFVAKYRFYERPMDGATARSVERFVRAKLRVMQRLFDEPATPAALRALRKRATVGVYLWACEEARAVGDSRSAFGYFAEALSHFGLAGRVAAAGLRFYLRQRDKTARRVRRVRYRRSPSLSRALTVGRVLAADRPEVGRVLRVLSRASRVLAILGNLAVIAVGVLLVYLIFPKGR